MSADVDVLVIGAGQAGLAVSHELTALGVEHVVFESDGVGAAWAHRWDSLCLVTPNHTIRLPGGEYRGPEPSGYLARDEIVSHLRAYAESFGAPVEAARPVTALTPDDGGFRADTPAGAVRARRVVVCTGAYQREYLPPWTEPLAHRVPVVGSGEYRSPASLPGGPVLVVGGGQSAAQIAEELCGAGREVALAAGAAPAMPRRIAGRDGVDWLIDAGFFQHTLADMPSSTVRLAPNPLATGAHGGHDLTLRTLAAAGVALSGRVTAVDGDRVVVADDLAASVAVGDEAYRQIWNAATTIAAERGLRGPEPLVRDESPLVATAPPPLSELGAVVVACGFRPAYSWIRVPDLVDELGFPTQDRGRSIRIAGLFFVGVPWMTSRRSPLFMGVGEDAAIVASQLAA
ncbi:NAD(P)-binding domain-containing protein [Agromyces silvae]|uniref:NAD(P)-binding domain-containing protein n=1 Tax=Agromyces silvae TaxID=3388266 RepID=UPI00280ABBB3|nr:NAD(P)-binding domain-containing protein [Agromyces protaetiae]